MGEVTMYSILFAVVGLIFIGISIPLSLGKVPPNSFYGCRTTKTLSDPKIWYEANRISGKDFLISGVPGNSPSPESGCKTPGPSKPHQVCGRLKLNYDLPCDSARGSL